MVGQHDTTLTVPAIDGSDVREVVHFAKVQSRGDAITQILMSILYSVLVYCVRYMLRAYLVFSGIECFEIFLHLLLHFDFDDAPSGVFFDSGFDFDDAPSDELRRSLSLPRRRPASFREQRIRRVPQ